MRGRLPEATRWRRGFEHVGYQFNEALMEFINHSACDGDLRELRPMCRMFLKAPTTLRQQFNEVSLAMLLRQSEQADPQEFRLRSTC